MQEHMRLKGQVGLLFEQAQEDDLDLARDRSERLAGLTVVCAEDITELRYLTCNGLHLLDPFIHKPIRPVLPAVQMLRASREGAGLLVADTAMAPLFFCPVPTAKLPGQEWTTKRSSGQVCSVSPESLVLGTLKGAATLHVPAFCFPSLLACDCSIQSFSAWRVYHWNCLNSPHLRSVQSPSVRPLVSAAASCPRGLAE